MSITRVDPRAFPSGASHRCSRRIAGLLAGIMLALLAGCMTPRRPVELPVAEQPPASPREFRAMWVATVANIDWPSRPGLAPEQQRAEALKILDRARESGLNAVILQVRPATDAMYPSLLEPWSEYLTGTQGLAPSPDYDPLQFWVEQAHRRGLELHAWFNPYRARHHTAKSTAAPNHVSRTLPAAVKTYGDLLWLDPGEPTAHAHTLAVVADVVRRYDIDGVHIDDYFYPYPIRAPATPGSTQAQAAELDFPDEPSWQRYVEGGGKLPRADWRRENVSQLVEGFYRTVHAIKPWVKVGVSPFGLGRPDRRPAGITGFSQYDKLYADVELWLERGWLDYLAPQLYWRRDSTGQAFGPLLAYWVRQNTAHRHLWPGMFTSMINDTPASWNPDEILAQIGLLRGQTGAGGHIHFSAVALLQDRRGIAARLKTEAYQQSALIPATPWLGTTAPRRPRLVSQFWRPQRLTLEPAATGPAPASYAIWRRYADGWQFAVQPASEPIVSTKRDQRHGAVELLVIRAVDRLGNESEPVALRFSR